MLQDKHRVLNNDPCICVKVSGAVVATDSGSDFKERSERSLIFCVTWNGEVTAEEAICFITDGRFNAAMARCPLLGLD